MNRFMNDCLCVSVYGGEGSGINEIGNGMSFDECFGYEDVY